MSPRGTANSRWQKGLLGFQDGRYSQSLEIGLAILKTFSAERPILGIADIADLLNMTRSTTHKYVVTLVACGFLEQDASRKYRLGQRASDVGMSALNATGLPGPSMPYLADLRERVGYTVSLAILDRNEIVYVARAYSHRKGQYEADVDRRVGSRVPASCTAMGKVLVAGLPQEDEHKWITNTKLTPAGPKTIVRKTLFRDELERVRKQGFAINDRELVAGMVAIAAPVQNGETVNAAISIAANAKVISAAALAKTWRDELLATASEFASHLDSNPQTRWRTM